MKGAGFTTPVAAKLTIHLLSAEGHSIAISLSFSTQEIACSRLASEPLRLLVPGDERPWVSALRSWGWLRGEVSFAPLRGSERASASSYRHADQASIRGIRHADAGIFSCLSAAGPCRLAFGAIVRKLAQVARYAFPVLCPILAWQILGCNVRAPCWPDN
jgi:hypothetical protein